MPEYWMRCYATMLPQLRVQEARALLDALLATNGRHLKDSDRNEYLRGLSESAGMQGRGQAPAPKATPAFLKSAGFKMAKPA